jgi:hypothetical protein
MNPIRVLAAVIAAFAVCGAAQADDATSGVGKWRWNGAASHYETGEYATEQTMEIRRNDADGISVAQTVTQKDGSTFDWSIDSPYDDKMRPGSKWMAFAFARISDHQFKDRYRMLGEDKVGGETFTISPKRIVIRGSWHKPGQDAKKYSYVEVWDRIE